MCYLEDESKVQGPADEENESTNIRGTALLSESDFLEGGTQASVDSEDFGDRPCLGCAAPRCVRGIAVEYFRNLAHTAAAEFFLVGAHERLA